MAAFKLLGKLVAYYAILAGLFALLLWAFPAWREFIPIGRVESLIAQAGGNQLPARGGGEAQLAHVAALGPSLVWLVSAVVGALLASLPVSWVYMEVRNPGDYDQ